jgi:hypothetical protein
MNTDILERIIDLTERQSNNIQNLAATLQTYCDELAEYIEAQL